MYIWVVRFPVYRKYANSKSYFKIASETSALEVQLLGSNCLEHTIEASIFPERQFIKDLLELSFPGILEADEGEFEAIMEMCRLRNVNQG
jgi:hypothetical protein